MNELLSTVIILIEVIMVLQCLQIVFKQAVKIDGYTIGIVLIDLLTYMLINLKIIPMICASVLYIMFVLYCYLEYRQSFIRTVIRVMIGFSLAACIEGIMAFITNVFRTDSNAKIILFLSSVLSLIAICVIKKTIPLLDIKKIAKSNKGIYIIFVFYGIAFIFLLIDYNLNKSILNIYVVIILVLLVFLSFYIYRLEQAHHEIEKQNYEIELQKIYGNTYEQLLQEVRKRQHDFKNQLGAIYSMHLTAHSLEELVDMQREYGGVLQKDCKFDDILTSCTNSILAGYIYYQCITCEKEEITIDYNICVDQALCSFAIHEIIEILGILINNACESFVPERNSRRCIGLELREDEEKIVIIVSNPAKYITYAQMEKMFKYGYSSKGTDRGIGLARVLELTNKYKADLKVYNSWYNEENWINIAIETLK